MKGIAHQEERVAAFSLLVSANRKSTGIDFHPVMIHPYGWMRHELSTHTAG